MELSDDGKGTGKTKAKDFIRKKRQLWTSFHQLCLSTNPLVTHQTLMSKEFHFPPLHFLNAVFLSVAESVLVGGSSHVSDVYEFHQRDMSCPPLNL